MRSEGKGRRVNEPSQAEVQEDWDTTILNSLMLIASGWVAKNMNSCYWKLTSGRWQLFFWKMQCLDLSQQCQSKASKWQAIEFGLLREDLSWCERKVKEWRMIGWMNSEFCRERNVMGGKYEIAIPLRLPATPQQCANPYLFPIFFSPLPHPVMVTPFLKYAFIVCNHDFSIEIIWLSL